MDVTSKSAASSSTNKIVSSNLTPYTLRTYHQRSLLRRPHYPTLYQASSVTATGNEKLASVTLKFYTDDTLDNFISRDVCAWPRALAYIWARPTVVLRYW